MNTAIIEKVNKVISKKSYTESDVLYILAQTRKYLETIYSRNESFVKYPTMFLFGDWILHAKLNRSSAQKTLKEYEDFFAKQSGSGMFEFMHDGFTLFNKLKSDLASIFDNAGINNQIISKRSLWLSFTKQLLEILKDLPLESDGEIKSFTFRDTFADSDGTSVATFTIAFRDGRNKNFSIDLELLDYSRI